MAFDTMSVARMRQAYETATNRISNIRKANEKAIDRGAAIALTNGTALACGYANERWGTVPADDSSGYKELTVMGAPVDLLAGGGLLAGVMLGAFGKYDHFGLSVGNGSLSGFAYRFGAEFARRHAAAAAAAPAVSTKGARPQMQAGAAPWPDQGRAHHVQYADAP
jgi:hypothetical protein